MNTKKIKAKSEIKKVLKHIGFGEMLLALRESKELTQVKMAEKLDISKQDLCNIEKGRKLVSAERAVEFAKKLRMPPRSFVKYALQDQLDKAGIKGIVEINKVA